VERLGGLPVRRTTDCPCRRWSETAIRSRRMRSIILMLDLEDDAYEEDAYCQDWRGVFNQAQE
jgi:hypothetical protein